jgi:outer membrane protein assembly factor BamD
MTPGNFEVRNHLLFVVALGAALIGGGCLGGSDNPKPHVIRSKVAKTQPPKPAATDNTKVAKNTPPPKAKTEKTTKKAATEDTAVSAEPDRILYDRSMLDIKKGRYTEARLSLQALINTYPDSEYLAKAKLAVADSFYKEGGTSNLTQAVEEYKNFDIFFPFLDEAAYAQLQVGMAHYRMMEKSDRDITNAQAAEDDFQTFLLKYPTSPLVPKAQQELRDVQEVLADGEYKIARFYYIKQDYAASAARLIEVADRYPLYSDSDDAVWMLGDVYERARQVSKNEDTKNHFADLAAKCYARIITDYPLSDHVGAAKSRLKAMGMPVPVADTNAMARMQKQQQYEKQHHEVAVVRLPKGIFHSGPDIHTAAREGAPNLAPPTDALSATDVLKPGAAGPTFSMGTQPTNADQNAAGTTEAIGGQAEEAQQGVAADPNAPTTGVGARIIAVPANDAAAAAASNPPAATGNQAAPTTSSNAQTDATTSDSNAIPTFTPTAVAPANGGTVPAGQGTGTGTATPDPATGQPVTPGNPAGTSPETTAPASGAVPATQPGTGAQGQQPASTSGQSSSSSQNGTKPDAKAADSKSDDSKESSSKKKKGLKKLVPW